MPENAEAAKIIACCEADWAAHSNDCGGFLRAVAGDLGITLTGQANAIIDALDASTDWQQLGNAPDTASARAAQGDFVVAGLKAAPNGHVAIVVAAPPGPYPIGYWGKLNGVGKKNTGLNWSWTKADLARVAYYAITPG